ncbi:hypothetical protein [Teredinibacter turnerae]|uniref:hypothetical protein n=1 Tax=Teredinibacter turnerae TaxID=2426 RepID=UPI0003800D4E|nr:hypothetical protein [Teredinibacter turnerae]
MKFFLGTLLISFSSFSFSAADVWTDKVKIIEIYTGYKEGHILFKTSGAHINPGECSGFDLYSVEPGNADVQAILSVLLAAKMSGTDVKVAVDGNRCGTGGVQHLSGKASVSRVGSF